MRADSVTTALTAEALARMARDATEAARTYASQPGSNPLTASKLIEAAAALRCASLNA